MLEVEGELTVVLQCDENRPICRLCAVSDRECSFKLEKRLDEHKNGRSPVQGQISSSESTPRSFCPDQDDTSTQPSHVTNLHNASVDAPVNLIHTELLIHIMQYDNLFDLAGGTQENRRSNLLLGLNIALQTPYLMHQLLAFSAQHLAHTHPEKPSHYLHHAVSLQTHAISLFNASWTSVDKSNCVPIILFASLLGHQVLAETLRTREADLDAFITRYVQCTGTNRGIYVLATSAWPLLMESELEPVLSLSHRFTSRDPVGEHCRPLLDLVDSAADMTGGEKEACRDAIHYLQIGFDAAWGNEEVANRHQMICSWPMLVSPVFTDWLSRKRCEAVEILGYYAVLLHRGRMLWQCGGAGMYLLGLVAKELDRPSWLEMMVALASDENETNDRG